MSTLPSRPTSLPSGTSILIVDDDQSVCSVGRAFFESTFSDCEIVTATSGEEGLALAQQRPFDCIVLDYHMPGLDGSRVLQRLRSRQIFTPVVLYTGASREEIRDDVFTYPAADYIRKGAGKTWDRLANRVVYGVSTYRGEWWGEQSEYLFGDVSRTDEQCMWMFDERAANTIHLFGFEDVWGRAADGVRENPRQLLDYVLPEDRGQVEDALESLLRGEQVTVKYRVRKDGQVVLLQSQGIPVIENGDVFRLLGSTIQVT